MRYPRVGSCEPLRFRTPALAILALLLATAGPAMGQEMVPFPDCAEPVAIQDASAQLKERVSTIPETFCYWNEVGDPHFWEINNLGFHNGEMLLYGIELTSNGNNGLVRIDSLGTVQPFGQAGLPSDQRFDAGDLSTDGKKMYVNRAGLSPLYVVDLDTMTTTVVPMIGSTGHVHDWAYNPADGYLYGGDTVGQLAVLDPANGLRVDFTVTGMAGETPGLPSGIAYGGAWFDIFGLLWLHRNDGTLYGIDLGIPAIVDVQPGAPAASYNDGASCSPGSVYVGNLTMHIWQPSTKLCVATECSGFTALCDSLGGSLSCGLHNGNEYCVCTYWEQPLPTTDSCVATECFGFAAFCESVDGSLNCGLHHGNEYCVCTY